MYPARFQSVALACVLAAAAMSIPFASASGVRTNAENDASLGPTKSAGHFLGYPSPTYQWHGCHLTAGVKTPAMREPGQPDVGKGNKQGAVSFVVAAKPPYVTWKVRPGYKICGAQVSVTLTNPADDVDHLAEIGYTSGPTSGSTSATGRETIKVPISKHDSDPDVAKRLGGKTYTVLTVYDVTVFVKKG